MILRRFFHERLAQASYLVGCPDAGVAIVIDPNRDVDQYIAAASAEGLRISAVTETHIHADFASGALELADRTGATLFLSAEGGPDWSYGFAGESFVRLIRNGDAIQVGAVKLDVLHTPGHTPEHLTFVLTDDAVSLEPYCAFTGDFIFAGDVGRPDLLEKAAHIAGTMEAGARDLYRSLQSFKSFPNHLILWPGHGAGSACGKSLGSVPVTTLGYECATNWALKARSESEFVQSVLSGQPDPPTYFGEMKRLNRAGASPVRGFGAPPRVGGSRFVETLLEGHMVVDIRATEEVAAEYAPGTLHIPLGKSFLTWAGWLLPYDRRIFLLADTEEQAATARKELAMIGLDDVRGWFGYDALRAYRQAKGKLESIPQTTAEEYLERLKNASVLDVRGAAENAAGSIPGAINIPLGQLEKRIDEVPTGPVVVHCAGGTRSTIAISILRKHGRTDLVNLTGGYSDYRATCTR